VPPNVAAVLLNRVGGFYQRVFCKDRARLDYPTRRNLADPAMLESFRLRRRCGGVEISAVRRIWLSAG
jgi:hypothetical protein